MAKKSAVWEVPALKVPQWLDSWNEVVFDKKLFQDRPKEHFYLLSLPASVLKALTGVYRRSTKNRQPRAKDPNVQRGHQEERSQTIEQFVQFGFPWCEMGEAKRRSPDASLLRKPGWLPTTIIVNILTERDSRNGQKIAAADLAKVVDEDKTATITLPSSFSGPKWEPESIFPFEVIDGQHRLWAFEEFDPGNDFYLPVVAFHGLDRSWQAYLFWSVNITPKKINRSLAFDLYPLLRREDWLDRFAGHAIYRETRCQELVEALWSHPASPWVQRINMLGEKPSELERGVPMVTQAAWVRSLMASFVKEWKDEQQSGIGGLFGAARSENEVALPWNRAMQAAFLIYAGSQLKSAVQSHTSGWAKSLRQLKEPTLFEDDDSAFYGKFCLLATDQGIRGWLQITNDLCAVLSDKLKLANWTWENIYDLPESRTLAATDDGAVTLAHKSLSKQPCGKFLTELGSALAKYDWRTSSTPGLADAERVQRAAFRGSGGYKELRLQLLLHLERVSGDVGSAAKSVLQKLGYK